MLVHSVSILLATLVFFAALVSASPMQVRDVFIPPILYPHAGTIWKVGQHHNVTWLVRCDFLVRLVMTVNCRNITNPPAKITNGPGEIILAVNGYLDFSSLTSAGGHPTLLIG